MSGPAYFTIERLIVQCGSLSWLSGSMFALTGRWATEAVDARLTIALAGQSRRHGRHAELWAEQLPDSPALDARERIGPARHAHLEVVTAAVALPADDRVRVSVLHDVLLDWCLHRLAACADVAGGEPALPVRRVLEVVAADLERDRRDLARVRSALVTSGADLDAVRGERDRIERLVLAAD